MKNSNESSTAILVGVATGAVLMGLIIALVFGLKTGAAGAVLVILIVAVSIFSGWLIGLNQHIQKRNWCSYLKGYREGMAKKTLIINHPMCRQTIVIPDKE